MDQAQSSSSSDEPPELPLEATAMGAPAEQSMPYNKYLFSVTSWDPMSSEDWKKQKPNDTCFMRIKRDLFSIFQEPPPGMFVVPDEEDLTLVHALITGPFDTPYEGGFFYFTIRCPPNYPIQSPRVRLMTTGDGTVRFNPNLYKSGKVCLSILGTWAGPAWTPALSLSSLLISIQSLMNEKPYHNEPGYEKEKNPNDAKKYNKIIQHETIRVAVLEALERPDTFKRCMPHFDIIKTTFPQSYDYYEAVLKENLHLDGTPMNDPFGERRGRFAYASLLQRLKALKEKFKSLFDSQSAGGN